MQLDVFRDWFDGRFEHFVEQRTRRYQEFTGREALLGAIDQVKMLARGGKRVRPFLTYLSYKAEGGESPEKIERVLFAIELFHVFCLIHDDIIDEDDLRRGVMTVSAFARVQCAALGRPQLAGRVGNAQALLVGDLVFAWVFELLAPYMENETFAQEFMYTIDEVVIGQMIDVDLMARTTTSREAILEKMRLKTAGYTFVQPLRIGRVLAGKAGREATTDALGLAIGLGFQMQDDLLDIYGTEEDLGKTIASDIEESQHTLLTQYVVDAGGQDDIRELHVLVGQAVDDDRLYLLRNLFDRTGASNALRSDIDSQMQKARELAALLSWGNEEKEALSRFIAYVAARIT